MKFLGKSLIIFLLLFGTFVSAQTEFKIPEPPSKIYPVNDYANILSQEEAESLNTKLIGYSDSTSTQILVVLVNTLDGDDINYVGARWGEKWGIGQKGKNNGVVLLVAVQDRKLAIQAGRGTEDALTDMMSGIIINQYMVPYLKQGNYYGAVNIGANKIIEVLEGKFKGSNNKESTDSIVSELIIAVLVFSSSMLFIMMTLGGKNRGAYYDRRGKRRKDDDDFWGGGFGGGSFGGESSGGGFDGFGGGGSFGGGGASGSW